jgi:E3 ubiquitin-protein ligase RGLG
MGIKCGRESDVFEPSKNHKFFRDRFTSYTDLEQALRDAGLESSNLIVGIDFTRSNATNGGYPYFGDTNLHSAKVQPNLYQQVISIIGQTLESFDDDKLIPAYGFGDQSTTDKAVFPFLVDATTGLEAPCYTFNHVLQIYNDILSKISTGQIQMSGPTCFSALIRKAIEIVKVNRSYHILLIICDGEISNKQKTINAIVEASNHPLSIICIGVGKANFSIMEEFDDDIPKRKFDNFQFVDFYKTMKQCENEHVEFSKACMMEIPDQFNYIKKHILPYY